MLDLNRSEIEVDSIAFEPCWGSDLKLSTEYCQVTHIHTRSIRSSARTLILHLLVWQKQTTDTQCACGSTHTIQHNKTQWTTPPFVCSVNRAHQARGNFNSVCSFIPVTLYHRRQTGATHHDLMTCAVGCPQTLTLVTVPDCKWLINLVDIMAGFTS